MKIPVHVVWFKRDLRVFDHAPLFRAARECGASGAKILPIYVVEHSMITAPDFDASHWVFIEAGLRELREKLGNLGAPLVVCQGEVVDFFEKIRRKFELRKVWAHEETGNGLSYQRDRAVRRWAREKRVEIEEIPQNGVVRRLPTRDIWAVRWADRMSLPLTPAPKTLEGVRNLEIGPIPRLKDLRIDPTVRPRLQTGGENAAHEVLDSFLNSRGANYHRQMSSARTAEVACSRLSAHLTWGTISMRDVVHATRDRIEKTRGAKRETGLLAPPNWGLALSSFESRLHWHCHFMQKLEDEPRLEFEPLMKTLEGMRSDEMSARDLENFGAWKAGRTGFPYVDACARLLNRTGWLNFRARAMLVSFASYDLWLHWRQPSIHLARMFLDYEPGIHYSQFQMQSGTTGINTIRVYSPIKQAHDQDPKGEFIRKWVPELRDVPLEWLHEPEKMPLDVQKSSGCIIGENYPAPIVDHLTASKAAHARVAEYRKRPEVKAEAELIREKHGSRRPPPRRGKATARPRRKKVPSDQLSLELE